MNELPADVGALVEHWRRAMPDREAIRFGQRSWTWAQFANRVERNAAAQVAAGLRPGDRVAVWDSSSPVHLETMLACLRAGTVLVPVNFRYSAEEAGYLIKDARARLLIVGSEFRHRADSIEADLPSGTRVITSDDSQYRRWLADARPATGLPDPRADACFLQIYTSGTTGFPKGAMLTGANLTANAVALGPAVGVSPDSVWMAGLPCARAR
jgi:acyl-CoA synthetase (AMP-forming)/AMP-acid ligase II